MQRYKVKIFYFPKANLVLEKEQLNKFKKNNTVLRVKHIKTPGCEEKILKVIYMPKSEKKDSQPIKADYPVF